MSCITIAGCILAFAIAAGPPAHAGEGAQPLSPVTIEETRQAVAQELRSRGFGEEVRVEDLELPVAVPARAGRNLRVSSACWDADTGRARLRLECGGVGACLPFLVYVHTAWHAEGASCRRDWGTSSTPHAAKPEVRAGERATAVLDAAGLRMTAEVTCLERGARGEIIRVRGREGRIFRVRVAGRGRVEALPQ